MSQFICTRFLNPRTCFNIGTKSCISYEHSPTTKLKKKSDQTKYRIPLLNNNESRMWEATMGDQWKLGPRSNVRNMKELAENIGVFPSLEPQPFNNFNHSKFNHVKLRKVYKSSELSQFYPGYTFGGARTGNTGQSFKRFSARISTSQDVMSGKGVTGTSNIGKSFGPPKYLSFKEGHEYDERFESRILQIEFRSNMTPRGLLKFFRTTVAVGNGNGMLGVGITMHPRLQDALCEAKQYGYQQLVYFPMYENGSIPYSRRGGYHRTELHAIPIAIGENKAQRVVKMMLDLAGYRGVAVKMFGRNTPEHLVKAFFNTFQNFESHQEQAENLGRYVVKFDPTKYFHPTVLAEPSSISASMPVPYSAEVPHSSHYIISDYKHKPSVESDNLAISPENWVCTKPEKIVNQPEKIVDEGKYWNCESCGYEFNSIKKRICKLCFYRKNKS